MATLEYVEPANRIVDTIEQVLCERARFYSKPEEFRTLTIFDRERGQFLLVDEGWNGYRRIYTTWVHVEFQNGKV